MGATHISGPLVSRNGIASVAQPALLVAEQGARRLAITVPAQANTDFTLAIPTGATIVQFKVYTTTAFTGTTVELTVGNVAGGAQYAGLTNIKAQGVHTPIFVAAGSPDLASFPASPGVLHIRVVQTGPTAVGAATFVAEIVMP